RGRCGLHGALLGRLAWRSGESIPVSREHLSKRGNHPRLFPAPRILFCEPCHRPDRARTPPPPPSYTPGSPAGPTPHPTIGPPSERTPDRRRSVIERVQSETGGCRVERRSP